MLWKWQQIFITQPLSCFVFHLPNLLLTQNFVYPTLFSSVPPPAKNNDRSLITRYLRFLLLGATSTPSGSSRSSGTPSSTGTNTPPFGPNRPLPPVPAGTAAPSATPPSSGNIPPYPTTAQANNLGKNINWIYEIHDIKNELSVVHFSA